MRLLIVDGWTREGNLSHALAGCEAQAGVFASLVRECLPEADIRIVDTNSEAGPADLDFSQYDAAIWTGGGGNIYEDDRFNRRQLELGERVLADVPHVWGSCWGFQVIVTVCGGRWRRPARRKSASQPVLRPEQWITLRPFIEANRPRSMRPLIISTRLHNCHASLTLSPKTRLRYRPLYRRTGAVFCTQYHPELPYDYIGKLLVHWAPNYTSMFTEEAFQSLLAGLKKKEKEEKTLRKIEFRNWLEFVGKGR